LTYASVVAADAPQHWWRLADPGGLYLHDIGSSPVMILLDSSDTLPYTGQSADGGSGLTAPLLKIDSPVRNLVLGTSFSLEVWDWRWDAGIYGVLGLDAGAGAGAGMRYNDATHILAYFTGGASTAVLLTPAQQTWHHWVMTYDHVNVRTYFDGVLKDTTATVATPATPYLVHIGSDRDGTSHFKGNLADAAIYTTVLSGARVAAHYAAADTLTQAPVYGASRTFDLTASVPGVAGGDLDLILRSVRKTY